MKLYQVLSILAVVSVALAAGCSKGTTEQAAPAAGVAAASDEGFVAIDSSLLEKVKYDGAAQTLTVVFDSGETYVYAGVPQAIYDGLMAAPSKGSFFEASIKDAFQFEKK
ncbi:MAG TPA: KTSC domain-containing protein [Kiritimatiellia bacterium]|nr:KTSC domain-containing protein [Kiritimatiellia bacterium]HNR93588.1 KTSC domain-containing protein [Kiritimatiellia bacterium]HNS80732.1 KTSC domain-containing protein [Kiritimatiellia bacterium]HPA77775.1 KTSC domain-containing protein [Kiritimatiellia bacterium]HQQ04588.1 KTSC domain-containing protein [Kiritimatiellia bacterium]